MPKPLIPLGIHEEFHRWVLRKRWIQWFSRRKPSTFGNSMRFLMLSERLKEFRPTYSQREERRPGDEFDM